MTEEINYIRMQAKFPGVCTSCGLEIEEGTTILWAQGHGAKHDLCPEKIKPDNGITVIDEKSDEPKTWKDQKKYSYAEIQKMTSCQCCGKDMTKVSDSYIDDDRLVCAECFAT